VETHPLYGVFLLFLTAAAPRTPGPTQIGKPRDIVSPGVIDVVIQEHRWKQAEFERRVGSQPLDDLPGALVFLVRVGPHQVEVQLIGVRLGQELAPAGEGFQAALTQAS